MDLTRSPRRLLAALVLLAAGATMSRAAGPETRVPRWEPHDFAFSTETRPENPYAVQFSARVSGPDGVTFDVPGFYDGRGEWKVRVSPSAEGRWTLDTRSDEPSLDGKRAAFVCGPPENPRVHGRLRVDPAHPRHFVFEDGTRFFLMGYECDWLWALDAGDPSLRTINALLDTLVAHGFNDVILNAYAHDTSWRKGKTSDDDHGPPALYPWEGTNDQPDHGRFNLAYWQHYDRVIDALHRRGIVAHVLIKVYNKMVRWPGRGSVEDDRYFRWLIARYAAYPNVVWDFSKEAHNEKDLDYKLGRLRFIRGNDPYRHLLTVHDDDALYDGGQFDELLDFRADQQHAKWHETILAQRRRHAWPVVNVEFGYEHGPGGLGDKTYGVVQPPEEVCRRAWEICLAGGYVAYYYTNTAWDVIRPDEVPPGYAYFQRLRAFFEGTRYWLLEPADHLISAGYCLADPGREYVAFQDEARPFTLKLEGLSLPLRAEWYHPLTGERVPAGVLENGNVKLHPPARWGKGPVALHVGRRPDAAGASSP